MARSVRTGRVQALFAVLLLFTIGVAGCSPPGEGRAQWLRTVTLLHTSDLHSHLFPDRIQVTRTDAARGLGEAGTLAEVGGAARLATVLDEQRARAETSIYLDSGDVFEGTPVFELFGGRAELEVEAAISPDAVAAGNHDLGAGLTALRGRPRQAPPLLGGNLDAEYPGLLESDAVIDRGGLRVAVIGLARSPEHPPDVQGAADFVNAVAARLGPGVDLVVVLSHLGRDLDLALVPLTEGIDVLLGGHTHDVTSSPVWVLDCGPSVAVLRGCLPRQVAIVHSGAYGRFVGRVDIVLSGAEGRSSPGAGSVGPHLEDIRYRLIPVTEDIAERPDVSALLEPYAAALEQAGFEEPVAEAPVAVERLAPSGGDSALGNLVTRAMRTLGEGDLAVINSTSLRADLPASVLSRGELFGATPFGDKLVGRVMSGREITRAFTRIAAASCLRARQSQAQLDGATVVFGCSGGGTAQVSIAGAPLGADVEYRVLTTDFLAADGGWLAGSLVLPGLGSVRDAVEAYVRRAEPCPGSWSRLPCIDRRSGAARDGRISWESGP